MAGLSRDALLEHLRVESLRFRDVLEFCDPEALVPACPGWNAADLLWHLAETQWFWGTTVRNRPAAPSEDRGYPERPHTYGGLLTAFDGYSAMFQQELALADPQEEAWSWVTDQTVGFTLRRQTHEALIHRLDAEQAAGSVTPLDATLAADGVLEILDVLHGGTPSRGTFEAGRQHLRVDCDDTGDQVWVQTGLIVDTDSVDGSRPAEQGIRVTTASTNGADAVIAGAAAALDAWLWKRGDDAAISIRGDRTAFDHFVVAVARPID